MEDSKMFDSDNTDAAAATDRHTVDQYVLDRWPNLSPNADQPQAPVTAEAAIADLAADDTRDNTSAFIEALLADEFEPPCAAPEVPKTSPVLKEVATGDAPPEPTKENTNPAYLDALSARKKRIAKQAEAMGYTRPPEFKIQPSETPPKPRPAPVQKPLDPVRLLGRMLADRASHFQVINDAKAWIFKVPSAEWCDAGLLVGVRDSVQSYICGGLEIRAVPPFRTYMEGSEWTAKNKPKRYGEKGDGEEDIIHAYWQGEVVIGVCTDLNQMPGDLVRGADVVLDMGAVDKSIMLGLIKILTGDLPEAQVPEWLAAALSPDDYRICRRVGQTPDDYLSRLTWRAESGLLNAKKVQAERERDLSALDNLYGAKVAAAWCKGLKTDVAGFLAGELTWNDVDRGALISGPTGSGKTTFAKKVALACGVRLIYCSYAEFQGAGKEGHLGELIHALRAKFAEARAEAAANGAVILAIDEIDSFRKRGEGRYDEWWTAITNCLLAEMDGLEGREGVIVLGLTNHPHIVDPALRRPGRLDRHIVIGLPDSEELAAILAQHMGDCAVGLDLLSVTRDSKGASGADAEQWARGARRRARHAGRPVNLADIRAEIGAEKPKRTDELNARIAIHEAAHAVIMEELRPGVVSVVSVRDAGPNGGGVACNDRGDRSLHIADLEGLIVELLAGRAGEEVLLGNISVGSAGSQDSDLAQATKIAADIELSFGGEGLLWLGGDDAVSVLRMRPDIAKRTSDRLDRLYAATLALVRKNTHKVIVVAGLLTTQDTLTGDEARAAMVGPLAAEAAVAALATHTAPGGIQ